MNFVELKWKIFVQKNIHKTTANRKSCNCDKNYQKVKCTLLCIKKPGNEIKEVGIEDNHLQYNNTEHPYDGRGQVNISRNQPYPKQSINQPGYQGIFYNRFQMSVKIVNSGNLIRLIQ